MDGCKQSLILYSGRNADDQNFHRNEDSDDRPREVWEKNNDFPVNRAKGSYYYSLGEKTQNKK